MVGEAAPAVHQRAVRMRGAVDAAARWVPSHHTHSAHVGGVRCMCACVRSRSVASGLRRDAQCTHAAHWRRTVRAVRHEHGAWADHADDASAARDAVHWQLRPHEDSQHRRFQLTRMYNYEDHSDAAVR